VHKTIAFIIAVLLPLCVWSQDGELLEYQQEVGAGLGLMSYIGDAGGGVMANHGATEAL